MRSVRTLALFLALSSPAFATAIRVDSEAEFLSSIETPYLFEDFEEYQYGSLIAPTLTLAQNDYLAVMSAQTKLYSGVGNMSTKCINDLLVVDFSDSPEPVTAVGGYFWPTDIHGNNLTGYTKIVLSDGSVYEIENAAYGSFLGVIGTDGTFFERLEISVLGSALIPYTWPTVDNLYAGAARSLVGGDETPIPNPEPSALLLLFTGLCGLGIKLLRRK